MMGERTVAQEALFYEFNLERHVPASRCSGPHGARDPTFRRLKPDGWSIQSPPDTANTSYLRYRRCVGPSRRLETSLHPVILACDGLPGR